MKTTHKIIFGNAKNMEFIPSESIGAMITSPPYPMIEMWDAIFGKQNPEIEKALHDKKGNNAFALMHQELDKVWGEVYRILVPGGIACINIGDATRTIDSNFQLYSNHARILEHCLNIGFNNLPAIIWRKQTNAPNKFMGSGMLPPGAYVTLEHEYVLILRKGNKREFKAGADTLNRQRSAFFWEERNNWLSDVWFDLKGTRQDLKDKELRSRSGAFPFELAYRLISMFSVKGDTVVDPFMGTGTTMMAAMLSARNSIGVEIDHLFDAAIANRAENVITFGNEYLQNRVENHKVFVKERTDKNGELKYHNNILNLPVMTRQERELSLEQLTDIQKKDESFYEVSYGESITGEPMMSIPGKATKIHKCAKSKTTARDEDLIKQGSFEF
jgi:DNA modification methylase